MQLKIATPKEMIERLPIAVAQVKAGNTSENLLNKIWENIEQKKLLKNYITM